MMRDEFEKLTKKRCGALCYEQLIEPMYMALPEFTSKSEFVRGINFYILQRDFYIELINLGAAGVLGTDSMVTLLSDLDYLKIMDALYIDTDSIKSFMGGYTHAKPEEV